MNGKDTYNMCKGAFTNYVDKILAFFDHLHTFVDIFYGMNVDKSGHVLTTYLPRLVNVVCEQLLRMSARILMG